MADTIMSAKFLQPVYKTATTTGEVAEAGDTIRVLKKSADGTNPLQDLVITAISEDGTEIFWEYDATSSYTRSEDIYALDPRHQWECPAVDNVGLVAVDDITATVTEFTVNGVSSGVVSFAVSAAGATQFQDALNEALAGNGAATVVYVDTGTDYLKVYVMGTTATIVVTPGGTLAAI